MAFKPITSAFTAKTLSHNKVTNVFLDGDMYSDK